MRTEQDYLGQPIRSLQHMLREISFYHPAIPRVTEDGIFGSETLEAIMVFQREQGLPVTGLVDNDTWDAIVLVYYRALPALAPPRSLNGFPHPCFRVRAGQSCTHMYLVQAMFQALRHSLSGIEGGPVNGSHTGPSVRNTVWLQRRSGLPETGNFDQLTWNRLVRLYEIFLTRLFDPAQCVTEFSNTAPQSPATRGFPWEPYDRC